MVEAHTDKPVTYGRIFRFWSPLAGTWLMMSVEGPFLAAAIARLPEPTENLAAYGISFAFALIIEAPVIMLLSASTALVTDKTSYLALRRFTYALNAALTAVMVALLIPPIFSFFTGTLLNLPEEISRLTYGSLVLLLPWPGAIGYRRFLQGTLVRHDMTQRVAYGTIVRVTFMVLGAAAGAWVFGLAGAHVGAMALSIGVVAEAIASRIMAHGVVNDLLTGRRARELPEKLTLAGISSFYFPLATMSILAMAIHPMVTFFMGRSRLAIESLAILPVVHGLVFVFRSLGLSYQEVTIALMGDHGEHFEKIRNFATGIAAAASVGLGLIVFTPLAGSWFQTVSGLSPELADLALVPARIAAVLPALSVLMSFQRALLVSARMTKPLTGATLVEVGGIAAVLSIAIFGLDIMGAIAATSALTLGRIAGNSYLGPPCFAAVRKLRETTLGA
jgi:hypothetical protein